MRRFVALLTVFAFAFAAIAPPAAFAAGGPGSTPYVIKNLTFESTSPTFSSNKPLVLPGEPMSAYWGRVSGSAKTGAYGWWCAGTAYPSGAARSYTATYPIGTSGDAVLKLPELKDYYSSKASFYYYYPSHGTYDDASFSVIRQALDSAGNPIGLASSDIPALTTTWAARSYNLAADLRVPLSRTPGMIDFRFNDGEEPAGDPKPTGQGVTIDNLVVSGYKYGPIRSLRAARNADGSVSLTWVKPQTSLTNITSDSRTIAYRVWRSEDSVPGVWTDLTGANRLSTLSYKDSPAKADASHYFVQAWDPGTGTGYGDPAGSKVAVTAVPDSTAPRTSISPVMPTTWVKSITFSLTASDEINNTIRTYYKINGGATQTYTGPVTLSAQEGTVGIDYWSKDQADNVEAAHHTSVKLDHTAPSTGIAFAYNAGSTTFALSPSDPLSGVKATYYSVDGGTLQSGTSGIISGIGTHALSWYSIDNAGNQEARHSASVQVYAVNVTPVSGVDRYGTAVAASKLAFPNGASTVIVASGENFPDALGASALAGAESAPLLLSRKAYVPQSIIDEIRRLRATHVVIIGSTSAVSSAAQTTLASLVGGASHVERIGGVDRYATASMVAAKTASLAGARADVFLAVGDNFPDALAASPAAYAKKWPILLTTRKGLPVGTIDALTTMKPARVHILGSTGAVPQAVQDQLHAKFPKIAIDRWQGLNRYATAVDVANKSGLAWKGVAITTGEKFPDALAGGVMQGQLGGVVLLTKSASLVAETQIALTAHKSTILTVRYLGDTSSVSDTVRTAISNTLR